MLELYIYALDEFRFMHTRFVKILFFFFICLGAPLRAEGTDLIPAPYANQVISLDLKDLEIHSFFRIISEVTHLNIVSTKEVQGKISSMRLIDVPVKQVFDIVLRLNSLYAVRQGNVIIVYPITHFVNRN